jgi:hypothetical protein
VILNSSRAAKQSIDLGKVRQLIPKILGYSIQQIADYINLPEKEINVEAVLLVLAVRMPNELELLSSEMAQWSQRVLSLEKTN